MRRLHQPQRAPLKVLEDISGDLHLVFHNSRGCSGLTWSSRYGLIGMCTEAELGIIFRASVRHRKLNVKVICI